MNSLLVAIYCWVSFTLGFAVACLIMPIFITSKRLSEYEEESARCEK